MNTFNTICLLVFLVLIILQDFKHRAISWVLIPLTLIAHSLNAVEGVPQNVFYKNCIINIGFIALQLILLSMYLSIKNKRLVNIFDTYLGWGDVLFFVVLCVGFSPLNFIIFYISAMTLTLMASIIYNQILTKNKLQSIPLAGALSALLIVAIIIKHSISGLNFHDDTHLLNLLQHS